MDRHNAHLKLDGKTMDKYLLLEMVGQGRFGAVYRARNLKTQEIVAVKVSMLSKLQREGVMNYLDTETLIMQTVKHPSVIPALDVFRNKDFSFIVMPFYSDGDLDKFLKKNGKLPEADVVRLMMQILDGFRELHKQRIIHRDFKLANVLLQGDRAVIADFGLASRGKEMTLTRCGTPMTRAPEVTLAGFYDNRVDIWSLGVCFYQLLTGKNPFDVKTEKELEKAVVVCSGENLKFPSDVKISQPCKDLLRWMLQHNPKKRIFWDGIYKHPLFTSAETPAADLECTVIGLNPANYQAQKNEFVRVQDIDKLPEIVPESQEFQAGPLQAKGPVVEERPQVVDEPANQKVMEEERKFALIEKRVVYERDVIMATLKVAREVRKMSLHRLSQALILAYLLVKRCKIRAQGMVSRLDKGTEALEVGVEWVQKMQTTGRLTDKLDAFRRILKNAREMQLVLGEMAKDKITHEGLRAELTAALSLPENDLQATQKMLLHHWTNLVKEMKIVIFAEEDTDGVYKALAKCFMMSRPEELLPFLKEGRIFDFAEFEDIFLSIDIKTLVNKNLVSSAQ